MKRLTFITGVLALVVLAGCAVTNVHRGEALSASARWAQLPITNLAETPKAGQRAASILSTLLNQRGVRRLTSAPDARQSGGLPPVNPGAGSDRALQWARRQGYRYAVTGSVEEWHYKTGLDGEPAVGISLRVIDVNTGQTLWSASGSRAGWGYSTVSGTAQTLLNDLVDDMPISR